MVLRALLVSVLTVGCLQPAAAQGGRFSATETLSQLDALPKFKQSIRIGSVSSYDRTGGNDDGFSGKHSFLHREAAGLVIADLKGPGVITRIWTPTPTDDVVEFYFDGEARPRLSAPLRDLFSGKQFPFLTPVVGSGAGGFYSYVPLPYRESCKVVVKAERVQFYQINYATYPAGAGVETYSAAPSAAFKDDLERARKVFASSGAASLRGGETHKFTGTLAPGKSLTLLETKQPGRVVALRLGPARAFAGKERDILLKVFWDGEREPAVACPVGDFFGYAWGQPAVESLLVGTAGGINYSYLPMPFDKAARIELVSERRGGAAVEVSGEIVTTDAPRAADEGRLYALWRRENPTAEGRPFTFLDARGRGHVVGFILQAQGLEPGAIPEFFEGDDETAIDGETVIRGTGSEDFFNGGWYDVPGRWEDKVSLPLSGSLAFKRHLGRTGGYRFLLNDAYPYRRSVLSTIEHGPTGNKIPTDYAAVTFFYSENKPDVDLNPPPAERRVVADPASVVFTPGWTTPIHAFSWSNAVLAKKTEKIGGEELRFLSLRAEKREVFGNHYISFICEMPIAGKYRISIEAVAGPEGARVQLFKNETPVGQPADLFAAQRMKSPVIELGQLQLNEGDNRLMFKLIGKSGQSDVLGFDLYRIICERVE